MTRSAIFIATAILSLLSVFVVHSAEVPVATGVVVAPTYGSGWGRHHRTYRNGGSTVYGSYLQGQAAVIRARGQYNLNTSAAAINLEEARSRYLDNRRKYAETYFEMRRLNDSERASQRRPHVTPEQLSRWSEKAKPNRLTEMQFGFVSGKIRWPGVLMDEAFAPHREAIETTFVERTPANSGVGSQSHDSITTTVLRMQGILKSKIHDLRPGDYLAANKFLESLGYEARFEARPVGLASTTR